MIVYALRHKATGKFMPMMKKDKGYSHWNPNRPDKKIINETTHIRIFGNERAVRNAHHMWFNQPNLKYSGYTSANGEDDFELIPKDDGRQFDDLEIVEFELVEKRCLSLKKVTE